MQEIENLSHTAALEGYLLFGQEGHLYYTKGKIKSHIVGDTNTYLIVPKRKTASNYIEL